MTETVRIPLDSQQRLLERLLHLSRLNTDLVLLTGPSGAGKSFLAGLLAEQSDLLMPARLDARALDTNARFRDTLLGHWFAGAVFDADDALYDSMSRLLPGAPGKRLLVVDNAPWLNEVLLQELAGLYALAERDRPFMLLLGHADWAREVRRQLDDAHIGPVLEVEVPELSEEDRQQLWQALGRRPPADAPAVRYPGDLTGTMEPPMRKPVYQQWLEQKSVKILLTALILLGLVILIVSLLGGREPARSGPVRPMADTALREPAPSVPLVLAPEPAEPAPAEPVADNAPVRDWPAAPLPESPRVDTRVADSPDDSDKERVVIEDEVVSRLLQRERGKEAPAVEPVRPVAPAPVSPLSVLMQKPAGRYTLQLMAGRERSLLEPLAERHRLSPAWVYPRSINGQNWFVLVYGDFESPEQARRAIGGLPAELQAAKPWPKPFGQVQKEVKP